jgi:hypothetical protein
LYVELGVMVKHNHLLRQTIIDTGSAFSRFHKEAVVCIMFTGMHSYSTVNGGECLCLFAKQLNSHAAF